MALCNEHSGFKTDIDTLKIATSDQWKEIGKMRDRISGIYTRLNVILVTLLVATIGIIGGFLVK